MKKISTLLLVLLCNWSSLFAYKPNPDLTEIKKLSTHKIEQHAKWYFQYQDYTQAYAYYLALSQVKTKFTKKEMYQFGKAALYAGDYQLAQSHLAKVLEHQQQFPLVVFEYANALKHTYEFNKAISFFEQYIRQNPSKQAYCKIAAVHIEQCQQSLKAISTNSDVTLNSNYIATQGNTRALTPTSRHGYRLVEYQDEKGTSIRRLTANQEMEEMEGLVSNPLFRSAAPCIAPDGETVYFMRPEKTSNGALEYKLYSGKLNTDGELVNIHKLNSSVNRAGSSSMYPAVGYTEHGQEVLYFSSTQAGGNGGFDLWYVVRMSNGEFSQPYNLGMRVNSSEDEITPFFYQQASELYFSSNKTTGLGGFDVYKMTGAKTFWREDQATHLPSPINSIANDYFFVKENDTESFLSTNRYQANKDQTIHITQPLRAEAPNNTPFSKK